MIDIIIALFYQKLLMISIEAAIYLNKTICQYWRSVLLKLNQGTYEGFSFDGVDIYRGIQYAEFPKRFQVSHYRERFWCYELDLNAHHFPFTYHTHTRTTSTRADRNKSETSVHIQVQPQSMSLIMKIALLI